MNTYRIQYKYWITGKNYIWKCRRQITYTARSVDEAKLKFEADKRKGGSWGVLETAEIINIWQLVS